MNLIPEKEPNVQEKLTALRMKEQHLSESLKHQGGDEDAKEWLDTNSQLAGIREEIKTLTKSIPSAKSTGMIGEGTLRASAGKYPDGQQEEPVGT